MDAEAIIETIKRDLRKPTILGLWELHVLSNNGGAVGFYFKTLYKISKVVKENTRIKVHVCVKFDCWEDMFEQKAVRIFSDIILGQIRDRFPGVEDIPVDIVIDPGEVDF
ncbi:Uncharacterised protein [uncultured archaeon]|nr:Uncharacterised protein [uncultured archaeon]